ncbi:hypothetical protein [Micromonospora qiuiae]|uniref:hypothetical protein n=1 Tax=Micromonospora qiuiae TaxID=502268 RepID=UPI00194DCF5D|nr:hypothetical protein [Micromonospora qiuiae]
MTWFVAFAGHALHRRPGYADRLRADDPAFAEAFAHEVRRFYPFAPFVGGRPMTDLTYEGTRIRSTYRRLGPPPSAAGMGDEVARGWGGAVETVEQPAPPQPRHQQAQRDPGERHRPPPTARRSGPPATGIPPVPVECGRRAPSRSGGRPRR